MDDGERDSLNSLSEAVIAAAYEVANQLGSGFLEKVYERALVHELRLRGIAAEAQVPVRVCYKGAQVGDYYADVLVDNRLLVELKCADHLSNEHLAQCLNYLKATSRRLALPLNFQKTKVECRRVVNNF